MMIKMSLGNIVGLVLFSITLSVVTTPFTDKPAYAAMTCDEIQASIIGKRHSFSGPVSGVQRFSRNGTAEITLSSGFQDSGRWWCDNGQLCTKWKNIRDGKTGCFSLTSSGSSYNTSHGYTLRPN